VTDREAPLRRQVGLAVAASLVAGGLLGAAVWSRGERPVAWVRGRVLGGGVSLAVVVDARREAVREVALGADGSYRIGVPRSAHEPAVVLHGAGEGGALVESGPVALPEGDGAETELPPLALWRAQLRLRRRGERYRFDWSPIPAGEGYPERRRYSLLFAYTKTDGERGETSLLSSEPAMELPCRELLDVLKDRAPTATALEVSLRAFDPTDPAGPLWVGATQDWTLEAAE